MLFRSDNNTGKVDTWAAQMHTSNGTVNWTNNTANVKTSFTAISNVCYTLNLTYHRSDLLHISNLESGGAHVEIWIPEEEGHDEAADL